MLARKHEGLGVEVDPVLTAKLAILLNENYQAECEKYERMFSVAAHRFSDELLFAVSFNQVQKDKNSNEIPASLLLAISLDLKINDDIHEILTPLTEIMGQGMDLAFEKNLNMLEIIFPDWQEVTKTSNQKFDAYIKFSRENYELYRQAEELLKKE